jgi:hypothetical protein
MPLSPKLLTVLQLRHLGFLALFLLIGMVVTLIMPRLFVEEIVVFPMKQLTGADLLRPTLQNFTQFAYVTLSAMTVLAATLMADEPGFTRTLLWGVLAGGIVCIVTGLIDLGAASAGMESLLEPFRNADYALLTQDEIAGQKRVVGFTPEASSYGSICVQFAAAIALLRVVYPDGGQRILAALVAVGLVLMVLLSTSSTAYLGLAVLGLVYGANWVRRGVLSSAFGQRGLIWELFMGLGLIAALVFISVARSDLFDPFLKMIEEVIFNKPLTTSFYERSQWTNVAWETVASTWGLGVGFGSTRTSNWFAAVISNAGLIGAACMAVFLVQTFAKRPTWQSSLSIELLAGLKLSLLPALAMAAVAAPGPDFGLWMAVAFGAIAGVGALHPLRGDVDVDRRLPARAIVCGSVVNRGFARHNGESALDKPEPRSQF